MIIKNNRFLRNFSKYHLLVLLLHAFLPFFEDFFGFLQISVLLNKKIYIQENDYYVWIIFLNKQKSYFDETKADIIFSKILIFGRIERCRRNTSQLLDAR